MYLIEYKHLKAFLLGGKANFILRNIKTNNNLNYKIILSKNNEDIFNIYFKSTKWIFLGQINNSKQNFTINWMMPKTYKKEAIIFGTFYEIIFKEDRLPKGIEILYTGHCGHCGRLLTKPKYIELGIGQYCLDNL